MRTHPEWGYSPYAPLDRPERLTRPYICRLAPAADSVEVDWLGGEGVLRWRARGAAAWDGCPAADGHVRAEGLTPGTDCELYVETAGGRSDTRLVRPAEFPGTVVNYLHPDDAQYAFSGRYLCSPSICRCPSGRLVASMDVYGPGMPQNLQLLYASDDGGVTWRWLCELFPSFWGQLFRHGDALYMLSVSNEYGDLLIGRSHDEGAHWSAPTVLLRGAANTGERGVHRAPMPVVEHAGRLWTSVEYGAWQKSSFANGVVSCAADADLLDPANWLCTGFLPNDPALPGATAMPGAIEGNVVPAPDGSLALLLRYDVGKAKLLRADPDRPEAPLVFDRFVEAPFAHTKFYLLREADGSYLALGNPAPGRDCLSAYASRDLVRWELVRDLVDRRGLDIEHVAFQYPSWLRDGGDILALSRTAFGGAHNFHDSNAVTFHRFSL